MHCRSVAQLPCFSKTRSFFAPARCSCRMAAGYCCSPGALEYMWQRCFQARSVTRVATSRAEVGAGCQLTLVVHCWPSLKKKPPFQTLLQSLLVTFLSGTGVEIQVKCFATSVEEVEAMNLIALTTPPFDVDEGQAQEQTWCKTCAKQNCKIGS